MRRRRIENELSFGLRPLEDGAFVEIMDGRGPRGKGQGLSLRCLSDIHMLILTVDSSGLGGPSTLEI